ncbi:hypothetical protein [Bradyrhizobium canariense]|uniref:hypothetical protein n=1 Tax=Bradyrhizobium canariense TaxID=255045 RepID=UPI0011774CBA|nr:hypothetical protein [Bradyrhizobium canariense]
MNEAMLVFSVAPLDYHKMLFLLKHAQQRSGITLAAHYIKNLGHLVGPEFDMDPRQDGKGGSAPRLEPMRSMERSFRDARAAIAMRQPHPECRFWVRHVGANTLCQGLST